MHLLQFGEESHSKVTHKPFRLDKISAIRPIVFEALKFVKSGSALDLGCGVGRHALYLAKHGFRVVAVEKGSEMFAAVTELARLQKLPMKTEKSDVTTYVSSKKFDFVLSTMVLHFIPTAGQLRATRIMREATKKGGINVISSYSSKNPKNTRPYLLKPGNLRKEYESSGWRILVDRSYLSEPMPNSAGVLVQYWIIEFIAQKPC